MSNIVTLYVEDNVLRAYDTYGYMEDDREDLIIEVENGVSSDEYEYLLSDDEEGEGITDISGSFTGDYLIIKQEGLQEEGALLTIKKSDIYNTVVIPIEGRLLYKPVEQTEIPENYMWGRDILEE